MSAPRTDLDGARVAIVNWRDLDHPLAGGAEHYAWHVARAVRDAGAEVEFLTARAPGQTRRASVEGIRIDRAGGVLGFYPAALARLLRRRRRIDLVVDCSAGIPAFSPLVLRRRTPVVLVVHHVHQDQFATYFPRPVAALGRFLERASARVYRRRRVLAVSESTRTEMRHRLAWHGPIGILANGADRPAVDVVPEAKQPGRIAVLGRLVTHKRVDAVVEAFAALLADPTGLAPATAAGLHLDVVGAGPESPRLAARVAELGLAERVTLHGFVEETAKTELLTAASLHVCASDAEGWGQVVIEAAAHGTPTLARDVPGLRSSIRDGETGWLLPEADPEPLPQRLLAGLRAALVELDEPETAALLVKRTQAHAAGHDWPAMHARTRALLTTELATAASRRSPAIARPGRPDVALER
ncbi:glycosyltransferase family 4 protein [Nocardioides fonticola]|uniref:Glycosyltransferase family 4 protein n=1 Tax=Nocardioides fonticola TaxID=450363 RepID=A0ABP7XG97_9ACTN